MVVRRRIRAVLIPLALYVVSGSAAAYFVWHASNGPRGLKAKAEYLQQQADLKVELEQLKVDRELWRHRVELLQSAAVDRDLLEESARELLNRVDKRDVVIYLDQKR